MKHIARSCVRIRSRQAMRLPFAFLMLIALPVSAHPGEPTPSPSSIDATRVASIDVAAESDQKTRDDYSVLKLAASHLPNERHRIEGAWLAANERWAEAADQFRNAARYADKYSQHRLSMLYWHGVGVTRDRVEAYVWADIAAERGYPQFLAIREKMWAELTPEERAKVPALGNVRYAEFGDPKAKRRQNDAMAQAKRKITGSHTGFVGSLGIRQIAKNAKVLLNPRENYALSGIYRPDRIDSDRYWQAEDAVWKKGHATVGDFEATSLWREPATAPKAESETKPESKPEPNREPKQ